MKTSGIFIILLIASGFLVSSNGQTKSSGKVISGYATDNDFFPIVGAYILLDGDVTNTVTDEKGFYKLRVPRDTRYIGVYSTNNGFIEELVNERKRINFRFSSSVRSGKSISEPEPEYEEEVNVGYGTKKKRDLTTSVSKIDGRENRFIASNSVYDLLTGTVPGLQVNGDKVLIRGFSSIMGSNEPLYIVDGVPVTSVADISPRMVKSIEVLKGPATAIYGSRGANGVILIDLLDAGDLKDYDQGFSVNIPFVATKAPTNINGRNATLNATVNPGGPSAVVTFEYGTNSGYTEKINAAQTPVKGDSTFNVWAFLTNLQPGTIYHYKAVVTNSSGSSEGADFTFKTSGGPPFAETGTASETTPVSARLEGIINSNDMPATAVFEYGIDSTYGSSVTIPQDAFSGNTSKKVTAILTSLSSGVIYHYRIVATNELGTAYGSDMTFKASYEIGQLIDGGYIFYIDETGDHGLICAPADIEQSQVWADCIPPGATGKVTGTGIKNTEDIVNGCSTGVSAARLCYDLELNGYSDWFLPSVNELLLIYTNLHDKGLGNFKESFYWSSTQDKYGAWVVSFYYGNKSNQSRDRKDVLIRPVRAF